MSQGAGLQQSGRIVEQSAAELTRIWRLARAASRQKVFPGLLDGAMQSFFASAGRLLQAGGEPGAVWSSVAGTFRLSPELGPGEATAEWAVAMEVLAAVCESFGAGPAVAEWLAKAVAEAERRSTALAGGDGSARPPGLVVVRIHGEMPPPPRVLRASAEA
jgi:hypothetical protein